jgi:uncharacterized protein (DUF58 family)
VISQRDILRKVRQVEIRTRRAVTDVFAGSYHSVFRGQGIDFEEMREYTPGDDVRAINWNITARTNRPFVKIYREERELTMLLCVDLSASQAFGSQERSKRETAAELAAILAFSAMRNNDKVGLLLFTDRIERYIPPRKGMQHILRVVREILFSTPAGRGTDRTAALDYINHILSRRAVVFFISDMSAEAAPDRDSAFARMLAVTSMRHDLVVADLHDPREAKLPDVGIVLFEDPESGSRVEVDTGSQGCRATYERMALKEREKWTRLLRQCGADGFGIGTGDDLVRVLRGFMQGRTKVR